MQRTLLSHALLVVVLCLVAGAAIAGECKPINVRIGPSDFLGACSYAPPEYGEMDFAFCIDAPLRGTLRGTWHYYGPLDNGVYWPPPASLDPYVPSFPPAPYSALLAGWALDVIETNRGEIWAQDNYVFNFNAIGDQALFPFVSLSSITGGTGAYEYAEGWFGVIADDAGGWRGFMRGEICTP